MLYPLWIVAFRNKSVVINGIRLTGIVFLHLHSFFLLRAFYTFVLSFLIVQYHWALFGTIKDGGLLSFWSCGKAEENISSDEK